MVGKECGTGKEEWMKGLGTSKGNGKRFPRKKFFECRERALQALGRFFLLPLVLLILSGCQVFKEKSLSTDQSESVSTAVASEEIADHQQTSESTVSAENQELSREEEQMMQRVETVLAKLTLEEKVGQLFLARVPAVNQLEDIQSYHLGGYLLFGADFQGETVDSMKKKIAEYQAVSSLPLLIASDEEGGTVTRVGDLFGERFLAPQDIYREHGLEGIRADSLAKVQKLQSLGIYSGMFPVADVATDPQAFIYDRTLGTDQVTTAVYVAEVTALLKEQHFGSVLKHFPGYGNNGDSHTDIIYDSRSLEELRRDDFQPFIAGIKAGADSILTSHNVVSAIEEVPASISGKVNAIIRQELGFDGVVMTDDFDMQGLTQFTTQTEGAYKAIAAGNDLILSSHYQEQIPFILARVSAGELGEQRIEEAVRRVLIWKAKLGLLDNL